MSVLLNAYCWQVKHFFSYIYPFNNTIVFLQTAEFQVYMPWPEGQSCWHVWLHSTEKQARFSCGASCGTSAGCTASLCTAALTSWLCTANVPGLGGVARGQWLGYLVNVMAGVFHGEIIPERAQLISTLKCHFQLCSCKREVSLELLSCFIWRPTVQLHRPLTAHWLF